MDGITVERRPPFGSNPQVGERGTITQRRILRSALEVFAEVGYHDTRVELITKVSGCSRPTFYQYFSSKEDIFWKLAGLLGVAMVEMGDRLGPITPDARGVAALRDWLADFADLYDEYAPVFTSFQAAIRDHRAEASRSTLISKGFGEALLRGFPREAGKLETQKLANAVATMIVRCNFYWRKQAGQLGRERFVDGMAQTLHRLVLGSIVGVNAASLVAMPASGRRPLRDWPDPPVQPKQRILRPRGEKTRQGLLEAGAVVLTLRGYHDARVNDIVGEAGVSHGSFYRYFTSKEDLFRTLAEQVSRKMSELLDRFPVSADADALRAWLSEWLDTYRRHGGVLSAWQEIDFEHAELSAFSNRMAAFVFDRLSRIVSRRGFGDTIVDSLAMLAVIERVPFSVFTLGHLDQADAIEAMLVIIRRGVLGLDERALLTAS